MALNGMKIRSSIGLTPIAQPTVNVVNGDIYYDSTANAFEFFQNSAWVSLSTSTSGTFANVNLSNLSSTAVNVSLSPGVTNTINLGDASHNWAIGYIRELYDFQPVISIDVTNRKLYDVSGSISIDYSGRTLINSAGSGLMSWATSLQLGDTAGHNQMTIQPGAVQIINTLEFFGATSTNNISISANTSTAAYSLVLPTAQGTANQVLAQSGTAGILTWANALTNPMTTGGDTIYGGTSGVPTRLANGTSGQVLTSAGTTAAPTWNTPVTFNYYSGYMSGATWSTTSNSSMVDPTVSGTNTLTKRQGTNVTVSKAGSNLPGISFTPAASTSVYKITASFQGYNDSAAGDNAAWSMTDGTTVITTAGLQSYAISNGTGFITMIGIYVPGTGSTVTVKIQATAGTTGTCNFGQINSGTGSVAIEWTLTQLV